MKIHWLYFCAFVLIQQMFITVISARLLHGFPKNYCCEVEKTPKTIKHEEDILKLREECDQELGEPGEATERKRYGRWLCIAECISRKNKIINGDNTFNEDAFKDYVINEMATQDYHKDIAADVATKCTELAKEPSVDDATGCSKIPLKVMACVGKHFFNACPAESQDQSEQCADLREKFNKSE